MRWPSVVLAGIAIAVVGIAGWQIWEAKQLKIPKWLESDRPDCQVWDPNPQRNETATWSGDCQSSKATGQGTLTWRYTDPAGNPLTDTYSGRLSAGKYSGEGVAVWLDARYDGEWKDGKPNGFGTYTTSDGKQHAGEWIQGCLDDAGAIFWIDSDDETCKKLLAK